MRRPWTETTMNILITGASGKLGPYLLREARSGADKVIAWSGGSTGQRFGLPLAPVNLAEPDAVAAAFREARPDLVIHAGAMSAVVQCQADPEGARRINVDATARLAAHAAEGGARLVFVSTDMVFDGERGWYRETDSPAPLSVYGSSKASA